MFWIKKIERTPQKSGSAKRCVAAPVHTFRLHTWSTVCVPWVILGFKTSESKQNRGRKRTFCMRRRCTLGAPPFSIWMPIECSRICWNIMFEPKVGIWMFDRMSKPNVCWTECLNRTFEPNVVNQNWEWNFGDQQETLCGFGKDWIAGRSTVRPVAKI